ncbi:MAG TPA: EamA family transporter [Kribbellaceae bacterium]|nr:EamA family transporter [Kribbellaceae bacterium]
MTVPLTLPLAAVPLSVPLSSGLPASAVVMVLLAAVAHAGWNAIAHAVDDKLVAMTAFATGAAAVAVPLLAATSAPARASWPWLAASVAVHLAYQLLLVTSYKLGDFSQMYPLARGSAPLLVTVLAAVVVPEVPRPLELAGVVVVSVGLGSLVLAGGGTQRRRLPAVLAALATGCSIAVYTVIDGTGVRASGSPGGYTAWLMLLDGIPIVFFVLQRRGLALFGQLRRHAGVGLVGGSLSLAAYGLVLWAQTLGPLAPISALRETSIVVGAIIGAVVFKEGFGVRRLAATAVVATGVVLINLG